MSLASRLGLPLVRALDPETAHALTLKALKLGLAGRSRAAAPTILQESLWDLEFANPIGLAAGFDKNAEAIGPLFDLGFGFVEVGTVTPQPQPGNPRPRIFRLAADRAVINRLGFNSAGVDAVERNLAAWREGGRPGVVGVNLGKNKESEDAPGDYRIGAERLGGYADYLVINVSSPNTPGLRALQGRAELTRIVEAVKQAIAGLPSPPPVLIKIAPDLTLDDLDDVVAVARASEAGGLIVSNTTITRPDTLTSAARTQTGGLSGHPLFGLSTRMLGEAHRRLGGDLPLIGVGGVSSGADAYAKIRAGASLVQLYTALVYAGPDLIGRMVRELAALLESDGFTGLADAVGAADREGRRHPRG